MIASYRRDRFFCHAVFSMTRQSYRVRYYTHFFISIVFATGSNVACLAQEQTASQLVPDTVTIFAEVSPLANAVELILNHPVRDRIESLPAFAAFQETDQFKQIRLAIAGFEGSMGTSWHEALKQLSDRGVFIAYDSETRGAVLLIHSSDEDQLKRLRGFILGIAQMGKGGFRSVKQGDYRGFTGYVLHDNLRMALMDDWLLLTSQTELGKSVIDRYLDASGKSLESNPRYQEAIVGDSSRGSTLSTFVDVQAIRESGIAQDTLYSGITENIAIEVLLGGILSNLKETAYVSADLSLSKSGVSIVASTPHDRSWETPREYYFGSPLLAQSPALIETKERLFALSTTRDLSQMWLRAGDLMNQKANDDLAKADTQLTTFFSGRDFGEDILGSLDHQIQFVARRQDFADQRPKPAIRLPAFGFRFQMQKPKETSPEFRRVFQSLIGFLNVISAMQGQPQFDLGSRESDGVKLFTATYVPEPEQRESVSAPIHFNFSPTIGFAGNTMVLASTTSLAEAIISSNEAEESDTKSLNTQIELDAKTLRNILRDNKAQLIAQNMLEKGHGQQEAESEIEVLFELIQLFQRSSAHLTITTDRLELQTDVLLDTNIANSLDPR